MADRATEPVLFRQQAFFGCGCVVRMGTNCSAQDAPDAPDCPLDAVRTVAVVRRRTQELEKEMDALDAEIARRRGIPADAGELS